MTDSVFTRAAAELHNAGDGDDICSPFLSVLPATGVAISTFGDPFGSETIYATDSIAARLVEIQFDLGEGPSWQALHSRHPVVQSDLLNAEMTTWPMALREMQATGAAATYAFPMHLVNLNVGVVDLYSRTPGALTAQSLLDAAALAEGAARHVLRRALRRARDDTADGGSGADSSWQSRREVHQASGMLIAQTGVSAEDALLMLRGYAFAAGQTVRALAADLTNRRINFSNHPGTAPKGGSSHDSDS